MHPVDLCHSCDPNLRLPSLSCHNCDPPCAGFVIPVSVLRVWKINPFLSPQQFCFHLAYPNTHLDESSPSHCRYTLLFCSTRSHARAHARTHAHMCVHSTKSVIISWSASMRQQRRCWRCCSCCSCCCCTHDGWRQRCLKVPQKCARAFVCPPTEP